MQTMYPAVVNSPKTELVVAITETDTEIEVADVSVLLQPEGLAVIGNGEGAETIKYTEVEGNILKNCIRGFQGTAKPWGAGTRLARNFTAYDHDAFKANIEQHDTAISALEDRLDTSDTVDITLQPGLQVVDAAKNSRFKLGEIKGRTLINILGDAGDCETTTSLITSAATSSLDTTNRTSGMASLIATATADTAFGLFKTISNIVSPDKYYLAIASLRVGTSTSGDLRLIKVDYTRIKSSLAHTGTEFKDCVLLLSPTDISNAGDGARLYARFEGGAIGLTGGVDSMRLYEITQEDYNALSLLAPEQVAAKYPFVPTGIVGVENPYAIGYGENLLPPFYEWTLNSYAGGKIKIVSDYEVQITASGIYGQYEIISHAIRALPGETFTLSREGTANRIIVRFYDSAGGLISAVDNASTNGGNITFTVPEGAETIETRLYSNEAGTFTAKNPMLVVGAEAKPFKPQRKSMLAFQTELHANPLDGSEPDILFEKEGQYFKLAKWKKIVLDGSLNWRMAGTVIAGAKALAIDGFSALFGGNSAIQQEVATKYNGAKLTVQKTGEFAAGDRINYSSGNGVLYLSVPNTDSGWGDNYTPTAGEIKAYFLGWRMCQVETAGLYNGTGTKCWGKITNPANKIGVGGWIATTVLPTESYDYDELGNKFTPYQLLYRLAKETVETVPFEGALMLPEGQSVVEVGTGIILREQANPLPDVYGNYYINSSFSGYEQTRLKYKVEDIKNVYNDGKDVSFIRDTLDAWGNVRAKFYDYDPSTPYTVTYIKLDKSPIQPITGVVSNNEKAQISDLTAAVAEALQQVSVVQMKKAEKDAPGWITPTLLNGWTNYGGATNPVGYYKDASGLVHLRGVARPGTMGVAMFSFITECRPKSQFNLGTVGDAGNGSKVPAQVGINTTGELIPASTATTWVSLDGLSFPV